MANLMNESPDIEVKQNEPLMNYAYTRAGDPADWLALPETIDQVRKLVDYAREHRMGLTVLGNASNLIVDNGSINDLTIILTRFSKIEVHDNRVTAQTGASYVTTTEAARDSELTGLEFAVGIPGNIGGAVFVNASAYGGETENVVSETTIMLPDGAIKYFTNEGLNFGYRHSSIQDNDGIMLDATFALEPGKYGDVKTRMDDLNERWEAKQPLDLPSCGSVFKQPEGYYAGKLIHDAGLQEYTSDGAQVSTGYTNFIVNINHGTAADYVSVTHRVQKAAKEKFGVDLRTEARAIGRQDWKDKV